jgi:hypothetical protein
MKIEEEKRTRERMSEIERLKPKIFMRISIDSYMLFWKHFWVHFLNTGGSVRDFNITCMFNSSVYRNNSSPIRIRYNSLDRSQQVDYDCGNIDNFKQYDTLFVKISVRDIKERRYEGTIQMPKGTLDNWVQIELSESAG